VLLDAPALPVSPLLPDDALRRDMRLPSLQGWTTRTVTTVRQLMGPFGRYNTNPPSLGQLREFVAACEGLDDNTSVSVEKGSLSESGTYNCSFSVRIEEELVATIEGGHGSMVSRYRKKPVEVEAMRYDGPGHVAGRQSTLQREAEEFEQVRKFIGPTFTTVHVGSTTHGGPEQYAPAIRTLEGVMRIDPGDWIIRGVKGEFYRCKPDIFEATYEPVGPPPARDNRIR
jgi:hypothetical protein